MNITDEERIQLAEAMNLPAVASAKKHGIHAGWFNPFTNANDDYKVLEWIRSQHFVTYLTAYLEHEYTQDYKIGDYARACLKVIE